METKHSDGVVEYIEGDILEYVGKKGHVVCHQCNCKTSYAMGLAKAIFTKCPSSNIYQDNCVKRLPGYSIVRQAVPRDKSSLIANMCAQVYPGRPRYAKLCNDSSEQRLLYFESCLRDAYEKVKKLDAMKHCVPTFVFPYGIGCGLARGKWQNYETLLHNFAKTNPEVKVLIIQKL